MDSAAPCRAGCPARAYRSPDTLTGVWGKGTNRSSRSRRRSGWPETEPNVPSAEKLQKSEWARERTSAVLEFTALGNREPTRFVGVLALIATGRKFPQSLPILCPPLHYEPFFQAQGFWRSALSRLHPPCRPCASSRPEELPASESPGEVNTPTGGDPNTKSAEQRLTARGASRCPALWVLSPTARPQLMQRSHARVVPGSDPARAPSAELGGPGRAPAAGRPRARPGGANRISLPFPWNAWRRIKKRLPPSSHTCIRGAAWSSGKVKRRTQFKLQPESA